MLNKTAHWTGVAILLLLAALLVGRNADRSGPDPLIGSCDQRDDLSFQPDLDSNGAVVRSGRKREISVRNQPPRSIRIMTKFVEVNTGTTEELGFDWIEGPFASE